MSDNYYNSSKQDLILQLRLRDKRIKELESERNFYYHQVDSADSCLIKAQIELLNSRRNFKKIPSWIRRLFKAD